MNPSSQLPEQSQQSPALDRPHPAPPKVAVAHRTCNSLGPSIAPFRFEDLPIEIQLQVLEYLAPEQELLQFRLVSSQMDTLVLEPSFWHELSLSKQRYFKMSHAAGSRRTSMGIGGGTQPSGSVAPLFFHSSEANVMVHRLSWAAQMLGSASAVPHSPVAAEGTRALVFEGGHPSEPPLTVAANLPSAVGLGFNSIGSNRKHNSSSIEDGLPVRLPHSWSSIEDSFLAFICRLSSQARPAHGIHRLAIEDWEDEVSMESLWASLIEFDTLRDLSIRTSVLRSLTWAYQAPSTTPQAWENLIRLDLKDCSQLSDLSGILQLMPHLEDISLEGCVGLLDFSPLAPETHVLDPSMCPKGLPYKKVNLVHTKIHDLELVQLLRRSPQLEELRLDQCYELTENSLMAIGYGHKNPATAPNLSVSTGQDPLPGTLSVSFCPELKVLSLKNCYDLADEGVRALAGCRQLQLLIIRGLRRVDEGTMEWLHMQGVPLRKALSPLGRWRHWHH